MNTRVPLDQKITTEGHILYVEGGKNSVDVQVLRKIISGVRVLPLGGASNLESLAEKFSDLHKNIYFVIDRDYRSAYRVQKIWQKFENGGNIVAWRRREIENYFIDAKFLSKSNYLKKDKKENLKSLIIAEAKKRIFLDAANFAFSEIKYGTKILGLKNNFTLKNFKTEKSAEEELKKFDFDHVKSHAGDFLTTKELVEKFKEKLNSISEDPENMQYEDRNWMELMRGKGILRGVAVSDYFDFKDLEPKLEKGQQEIAIIKEILENNVDSIPNDILKVKEMIIKKMKT